MNERQSAERNLVPYRSTPAHNKDEGDEDVEERVDGEVNRVAECCVCARQALPCRKRIEHLVKPEHRHNDARAECGIPKRVPELFRVQHGSEHEEVREKVHKRHIAFHALKIAPEALENICTLQVGQTDNDEERRERHQKP